MNQSGYQEFSILSRVLQDTLTIKIALPEGYADHPQQRYPSIYLLDANYFFDDAPGILDEYLVRGEGMAKIVQDLTQSGKIPPSILIGIGYSEEQRGKFTLDEPEAFYAFFRQELIPQIESKFQVSKSGRDRLLFGYSGSAHFSTYALFADVSAGVETFDKFISISGVYSGELETDRIEEKLFKEHGSCSFAGRSLFIAIGGDDPKDWLLDAHRIFTKKLANRGYTEFNLIPMEFPGKGHYDIPEYGFREGLLGLYESDLT